jgi:hypothetical protein
MYKSVPSTYKVIQRGVMKISKKRLIYIGLFSRYPNSSIHPNILRFGWKGIITVIKVSFQNQRTRKHKTLLMWTCWVKQVLLEQTQKKEPFHLIEGVEFAFFAKVKLLNRICLHWVWFNSPNSNKALEPSQI